MSRCPECNALLSLPPELGLYDRIYCEECGALLEVVSLSPLELEYVEDFDELDEEDLDWEDEEFEEEDFEEDLDEDEW